MTLGLLLVAGEGLVPLTVAQEARQQGYDLHIFTISYHANAAQKKALQALTPHPLQEINPGLLAQAIAQAKATQAHAIVFAGKVNKWHLLRRPRLDALSRQLLGQLIQKSDDNVMCRLIAYLEEQSGFSILPQRQFMGPLLRPQGLWTPEQPDEAQWQDIAYGFSLAKTIGQADIGQTVVVKNGMALAIEAIEGTDQCIARAGRWGRSGKYWLSTHQQLSGTVVKTAKPQQDTRFDLPTVGVRTLKAMRAAGLKTLATEAGETLYVDFDAMCQYATRHGQMLVSVSAEQLKMKVAQHV